MNGSIPNESKPGDWCPTCKVTVLLDWYTDERTGWDVHGECSTALVTRDPA